VKNKNVARLSVALSALVAVLLSTTVLGGPKGAQRVEGSFDWPEEGFYFECLNDHLSGTVFYTVLMHTVETPSGNIHMIENFFGTGHIYSLTTGETWTQKFSIPVNTKIGPGEHFVMRASEKYLPDDPHGTVFFIERWTTIIVNANGELKVLRDNQGPDIDFPSDVSRCAGKGKQ
jgi:hypothetical protein